MTLWRIGKKDRTRPVRTEKEQQHLAVYCRAKREGHSGLRAIQIADEAVGKVRPIA